MSKHELLRLYGFLLFLRAIKRLWSRRKRRFWVKHWIAKRSLGHYQGLMTDLVITDAFCYRNFIRMSSTQLETLLRLVGPSLKKQDTTFRRSIEPEQKLVITLRFLATGASYQDLHYNFRIVRSTLSDLLPETCKNIYLALENQFIQVWNFSWPTDRAYIQLGFENYSSVLVKRFQSPPNFPH